MYEHAGTGIRAGLLCGVFGVLLLLFSPGQADGQPVRGQHFDIGTNFTDSTYNESFFIPPDTMGAVSTDHIGILINGRWSVYDRGGTQQEEKSLDQFWVEAGVSPTNYSFDPRLLYDPADQRWYACSVDNGDSPNSFLVGVSDTSDPTGSWTGFKIDSDWDDSHWADFPTMGHNDDLLVISANMFPLDSGSTTTSLLALDKDDMNGGTVNGTIFENVDPDDTGFSVQPVVDLDNEAGSLSLLSAYNKPGGVLKRSEMDPPADSATLDTADGFMGVTERTEPPDIDQQGSKADVDAGDNRFSGNVVLQDGSLWATHGVDVGGRAAIEWYEIEESTDTVLQSGLIADSELAFNYPSISVNDFGDAVIGFSTGSPNRYMSTAFVYGRTTAGTTTFSDVIFSQDGLAGYERTDSTDRNRWGDYSATIVDPANQRHFWTFQEFAISEDTWAVKVTQITPEPSVLASLLVAVLALCGWRPRRGE